MTDRLNTIFSQLGNCRVFADIGCDHGYVAKAMLASGKASRVIISDISEACLDKAKKLLKEEICDGRAVAVVSDGFKKVEECDVALIAGMGGEEIVNIIKEADFLPERLVLQPMKNCNKVRLCAVKAGYRVIKDFVFFSAGKYYDLIVLEKGEDELSEEEIEFGRDNVEGKNSAFAMMVKDRIDKLKRYSERQGLSPETKKGMIEQINRLSKYVEIK